MVGRLLYAVGLGPVGPRISLGHAHRQRAGSLAMGCWSAGWRATAGGELGLAGCFLGVGVLGGFTTFSSFSMEFGHCWSSAAPSAWPRSMSALSLCRGHRRVVCRPRHDAGEA
jgi:fluoride ion exporter CrcB/FEX